MSEVVKGTLDRHETQIEKLWIAISELKETLNRRLPIWVSFLVSLLTFLLGVETTVIGFLSR